jgi:hypothetical protein
MKKLFLLMILAGCSTAGPSLPPLAEDTCGAIDYAQLIGQPATTLERVLLLGKVRVIRPGQPVTMDFWPDRINFMIDKGENIDAINCG